MRCDRREFLKAGARAALAGAIGPWLFRRRLAAADPGGSRKIIFIFQRGGSDAVNAVIPRGDPEYSAANRPTLFIPEAAALDLGNGFAQLHPALASLLEIYNASHLNGVAGPGNLAVLHRIGYEGQSQSHFDSQQYWETGLPGDPAFEEGMFYRQAARTMDLPNNRLAAAALASTQMVALKGRQPIPTIRDAGAFAFSGTAAERAKFLGELPSSPQGADGEGLLGLCGGPRDAAGKPYRDLVYGTGLALADAMRIVQAAVAQGPYEPANGALYPSTGFGDRLRQAAMLLRRTPVRVLGMNIGGWDTHVNQGQVTGAQPNLLRDLAQGIQALSRDLADQWADLLIVTMSEFGRTSIENGSRGTDHAHACAVLVAGGRVRGGAYNCDTSTWAAGDLFSAQGRYVRYRTDYRAVFGEIFVRHFGDDAALLDAVIPGFSSEAAKRPQAFASLGFLEG